MGTLRIAVLATCSWSLSVASASLPNVGTPMDWRIFGP